MLSSAQLVRSPRVMGWLLGGSLVLATIAAYWNSLNAPFFFDDRPSIVRNETIRHLWPLWDPLSPPNDGSGVSGRPIANLTLALNFAAGGLDVRGYHAANLTLHLLATLTLWGVLRRSLQKPALPERIRERSEMIAWSGALLWAVHPLLTESVVCVVQRNEILGGLFYLLTFYCFIRATETLGTRQRGWIGGAVLACFVGVASKEIVATTPLLLWLYDRAFVAGTFRAAWRERKWLYVALAMSWIPLAWLMIRNSQRGGTVGFGLGVSSWQYLLTQCQAITTYLKLTFWPDPLIVDYGTGFAKTLGEVWWQGSIVVALLVTTAALLWRKPALGFLGAWFFVILAPSSSFVPLTTQTIAEHRMYLPLIAPVVIFVLAISAWLNRRAVGLAAILAVILGTVTVRRNQDYRSEESIWKDTTIKRPENPRAFDGLASAYAAAGRWRDVIAACETAARLNPQYRGDLPAHLGQAWMGLGQPDRAVPLFEQMLSTRPDDADLNNNLGMALAALHRLPEAITRYEAAVRLNPASADAHNNLGNALAQSGNLSAAVSHYETAIALRPNDAEAEANWARSLAEAGKQTEAIPHFEAALRLRPGAEAQEQLARALVAAGRATDALEHYRAVLAARPESVEARIGFGNALAATDQIAAAQEQYEAALRLQPESAEAHYNLGNLSGRTGRFSDAIAHYQAAVRAQPEFAGAHHNLALALMHEGRATEALPHFEATVQLVPDSPEALHELALVLGELGRFAEAEQRELAVLKMKPDFPEAREHLAWLKQQQ